MSLHLKISARFGDFQLSVNEQLESSGLTAVFGPSGCGKTTLLRCIAGLNASSGEISLDHNCWQDAQYTAAPHQRNIAYVFQDGRLLPHLCVEDNILFNLKHRGLSSSPETQLEAYTACGINDLLKRYPAQLSGGQKQRVNLARALLSQPDLILMDEPLSALDRKAKQEMLAFLQEFKHRTKCPILYVTHSIDEVAQLADQIVLMDNGSVTYSGCALKCFAEHSHLFEYDALCSVFNAVVNNYSQEDQILSATLLPQTDETVLLHSRPLSKGQAIRLRVNARDVSISLTNNTEQSILNTLPAQVAKITHRSETGSAHLELKLLQHGQETLHALITSRSLRSLKLTEGQQVWAQVKALSIFD